jgi:hypothetical protein
MPQPKSKDQCPQCWQPRTWPEDFIGARGAPVRWCRVCQARYRGWGKKSLAEKIATPRRGVPVGDGQLRARLFVRSGNRKLGGIPSSMTARASCPASCSFYSAGCYAEYHLTAAHWRRVSERGDTWSAFCDDVARLPEGQLWRHNEAGDLPGRASAIHEGALFRLVLSNVGRRGFTFTHKHTTRKNRELIRDANDLGFTVNLSADDLRQADRLASFGVGPVAAVLPSSTPDEGTYTAEGRKVIVCPAERGPITCRECKLCALPHRRAIVGFRAHGQSAAQVSQRATRHLPVVA